MKKCVKIWLISIIFFFFIISVSKAQVIQGDVVLSSQAEVDSFKGTSITWSLLINGSGITDLSPLSTLTSIGGHLLIYQVPSLTNLEGLHNITTLGANLEVKQTHNLLSLNGLRNLASIGGSIKIEQNGELKNLGLNKLDSLGKSISILSNDSLITIDGFNNLITINEHLEISYNSSLINLNGFKNISNISGTFVISSNNALTNLDGLCNLEYVENGISIWGNHSLSNLDGLSNLRHLKGIMDIEMNSSLAQFCGLYTLISLGTARGHIIIQQNLINPSEQQILENGPCDPLDIAQYDLGELSVYRLDQNYPNPFNPTTIIRYTIPNSTVISNPQRGERSPNLEISPSGRNDNVSLIIYNILGKEIATLVNKTQPAGNYGVNFDASTLPSGVYYYQLKVGNFQKTKKMVLLR